MEGSTLTHHIKEDVAGRQHHLLASRSVVNAHVALIGAVVGDADFRKSRRNGERGEGGVI